MKKIWVLAAFVFVAGLGVFGTAALADRRGGDDEFGAKLNGYNEVNSKSTVARGRFSAELDGDTLKYTLSYKNLETPALFAHIHFAQRHVNGSVIAFLCGGGGKDPCPATTGSVSGVITAADVIGPNDQGIEPGSFDELVRAMSAGAAYANVHSERFPSGEIRGQIDED